MDSGLVEPLSEVEAEASSFLNHPPNHPFGVISNPRDGVIFVTMNVRNGRQGPVNYEIKVEGRLETRWSEHLGGFEIAYAAGTTTLVGAVKDQAALFGLLNRVRDLNLVLVSVRRLDAQETDL